LNLFLVFILKLNLKKFFKRKDSNFLVEELMLLANMEVAQRLYKYYDDRAMLRRHPTPKRKELKNMVRKFFANS